MSESKTTICHRCGKTLYDGIHTCTPKAEACVPQTTTEQKINQIVSGQLKSAMKAHPDQIKFIGSGLGSASKRITNAIISQLEGILNER